MSQTTFTPYAGKPASMAGCTDCQDELRLVVDVTAGLRLANAIIERLNSRHGGEDEVTVSIFGTKE